MEGVSSAGAFSDEGFCAFLCFLPHKKLFLSYRFEEKERVGILQHQRQQ